LGVDDVTRILTLALALTSLAVLAAAPAAAWAVNIAPHGTIVNVNLITDGTSCNFTPPNGSSPWCTTFTVRPPAGWKWTTDPACYGTANFASTASDPADAIEPVNFFTGGQGEAPSDDSTAPDSITTTCHVQRRMLVGHRPHRHYAIVHARSTSTWTMP
jgi:hypothetical protein